MPLLLQAPVFIILFRVLHKLTETCTASDVAKHASEGFCLKEGTFFPKYVSHSSELFLSLINMGEVYYRMAQIAGEDRATEALDLLRELPIEFVQVKESVVGGGHRSGN